MSRGTSAPCDINASANWIAGANQELERERRRSASPLLAWADKAGSHGNCIAGIASWPAMAIAGCPGPLAWGGRAAAQGGRPSTEAGPTTDPGQARGLCTHPRRCAGGPVSMGRNRLHLARSCPENIPLAALASSTSGSPGPGYDPGVARPPGLAGVADTPWPPSAVLGVSIDDLKH